MCAWCDLSHLSTARFVLVLAVLDDPEQQMFLSEIGLFTGNGFESNLFALLQDEVISAQWPVKRQQR